MGLQSEFYLTRNATSVALCKKDCTNPILTLTIPSPLGSSRVINDQWSMEASSKTIVVIFLRAKTSWVVSLESINSEKRNYLNYPKSTFWQDAFEFIYYFSCFVITICAVTVLSNPLYMIKSMKYIHGEYTVETVCKQHIDLVEERVAVTRKNLLPGDVLRVNDLLCQSNTCYVFTDNGSLKNLSNGKIVTLFRSNECVSPNNHFKMHFQTDGNLVLEKQFENDICAATMTHNAGCNKLYVHEKDGLIMSCTDGGNRIFST